MGRIAVVETNHKFEGAFNGPRADQQTANQDARGRIRFGSLRTVRIGLERWGDFLIEGDWPGGYDNRESVFGFQSISPCGVKQFASGVANLDDQNPIPLEDTLAIVQLLGETAGMESDLVSRKRFLMRGLSRLINADGWLWSMTRADHSKGQPVSVGVIYESLTESQFAGWVEASQIAKIPPPEDAPISKELLKGHHFTRSRDQLVPDEQWYSHPTIEKYRLQRGIDDFVYSIYPLGERCDSCSAIGLFRHKGHAKFTARERRIVHILLGSVAWLHSAGFPDAPAREVFELTPRKRMVLVHLLNGKRRVEIARLLSISEESVKSHTSEILRHFGKRDQVALMSHFLSGDGGDSESQ